MDFLIECTISGVGTKFSGTIKEALEEARNFIRFDTPGAGASIWTVEDNRKIALVRNGCEDWVSPTFLNPQTGDY